MISVKPSFIIETDIDTEDLFKHLEAIGRVCYKSEDRIKEGSSKEFISRIIQHGHESVIEHYSVSVRIICDRGVSHEIVRHRLASYSQESTRYCNYAKDKFSGQITCIEPSFWDKTKDLDREKYEIWKSAMDFCEEKYMQLLNLGATPQEARSVLPTSLKTELVATMNLRGWRHFFRLRTASQSHPQIREIAIPLLIEFKKIIPVIFDDICIELDEK